MENENNLIFQKNGTWGRNNPFYGKKHSKKSNEKNRLKHLGKKHSNETKLKMSSSHMGKHNKSHSEKTKNKLRIKTAERCLNFDYINEDKGSFEYFEKLNPSIITSYYLKDVGYYIDGYDIVNNIVYEYDTPYHYKPKQKEKDLIRQNNIIKYFRDIKNPLNAFIRINSETKEHIYV